MAEFIFGGSKIYYEMHGRGKVLLFIHGWNGSMTAFKINLVPILSERFQLIMFDLPGCGQSEWAPFSFEDISLLIESLLIELNVNSVSLVGFCMGGDFALDFAIRKPQFVKELYLIDTSIDFPLLLRPLLLPAVGKLILYFFLKTCIGQKLSSRYLLMRNHRYRENFYASFADNDIETSRNYIRLVHQYGKIDHYKRVADNLKCGLSIINGAHTMGYVKLSAKKLRNVKSDYQIYEIQNAAHFIIEEGAEQIADIIERHYSTTNVAH